MLNPIQRRQQELFIIMSGFSNTPTDNLVKSEDITDIGATEPDEEIPPQAAVHCVTSFAGINHMRKNAQLCDVTLEIDGETFHAHKVVLASASPYFYAMFNNDMVERTQRTVRLHDLDVVAVKNLIDYIYTGEISITEQNVLELLAASNLLQIYLAQEACCKFLIRHLLPSNCLSIRNFADIYSCKELHTESHKCVLQNFQQVAEAGEFLLLSYEEVRDLISNNSLYVFSEQTVFNAVLNWIKHDLNKRQKHIAELMSHVRLFLVHRDLLMTSLEAEPLIRDDSQCRELLTEAIKYRLLPEQRSLMDSERTQERRPDGIKPYIFAVGEYGECEAYNPRSNNWSTMASMLSRRESSGVAALYNTLYVVGGYDGKNTLKTVECYNPSTNKWSYTTPMGTERTDMGICTFNGLIYVCGSSAPYSMSSTAESYDPLTSIWSCIPNMNTERRSCRLAVLDNCIYCCGGTSYTNYLSNVDRFDPRVGRWESVPSMTSQRDFFAVVSHDSFLYCIGGENYDNTVLSSGERFNVRRNSWEPIADMEIGRAAFDVVEVEGSLYTLGGYIEGDDMYSMNRYDISRNTWSNSFSTIPYYIQYYLGAAVLDCFHLEENLESTT